MKPILFAIAALCWPASAFADPCIVKRTEAGLASVTSADISKDGKSAQKILLVTGPILSPLTIDQDAAGYTMKSLGQAALHIYRSGASVPDKDWREAGSIATQEGGFGIDWPRILHDGKPVTLRMTVRIRSGGGEAKPVFKGRGERDGVQLLLSDDVVPSPGWFAIERRTSASATANLREFWNSLVKTGSPLKLELYDLTAQRHIASAEFAWPSPEATQARYVADITALRKAHNDKTCKKR